VTRLTPPHAGSAPEPVPVASVQGTLALDLDRGTRPVPAPDLRVVDGGGGGRDDDLTAWAATFAQAVVEVVGGDRPVAQLLRWTTARVYDELSRRVRILARTAPAPQRMRTVRAQVRSVHVCRPSAHSAEVSVHVRHGQRSRALAARLERRHGRWTCTALQLG
jgi:hypothetical protein